MVMKQQSLGIVCFELAAKRTRKREFLDEINLIVPWLEPVALIQPHAPLGKTGRPAFAGLMLKMGTVVDATLIATPSSTKNKKGERDPEMHQTRKSNQWHFFRVIKRQFGYTKVRYKGLAKNTAQLMTLFALSNLWMVRKQILPKLTRKKVLNWIEHAVMQTFPKTTASTTQRLTDNFFEFRL
jgi:hypothetical protein